MKKFSDIIGRMPKRYWLLALLYCICIAIVINFFVERDPYLEVASEEGATTGEFVEGTIESNGVSIKTYSSLVEVEQFKGVYISPWYTVEGDFEVYVDGFITPKKDPKSADMSIVIEVKRDDGQITELVYGGGFATHNSWQHTWNVKGLDGSEIRIIATDNRSRSFGFFAFSEPIYPSVPMIPLIIVLCAVMFPITLVLLGVEYPSKANVDGYNADNRIRKYAKYIGFSILFIYLLMGLSIYDDYGQSWDEYVQYEKSIINYDYILDRVDNESRSIAEVNRFRRVGNLEEYYQKYYGTIVQLPMVAVEHLTNFTMDMGDIYKMRHLICFLNYLLAAFFIFLLLRRRYGDSILPIIALLMLMLFPRFFAESFYNIKDMPFFSWYSISVYFALLYIKMPSWKSTILFALTIAIATNIRIIGISVLCLAFAFQLGLFLYKREKQRIISLLPLVAVFIVVYNMIMPASWADPIRSIYNTFAVFVQFDDFNAPSMFMGAMVRPSEVPWYYVPVWVAVTSPISYILLFIIGNIAAIVTFSKDILKRHIADINIDDLFIFLLFWCSWLGTVILGVRFVDTWRHSFYLFLPILYFAIYGLNHVLLLASKVEHGRAVVYGIMGAVLIMNASWIIKNHPYQFMYYNSVARNFAEGNFTLDYYRVVYADLMKYILENDKREIVTILDTNNHHQILPKADRERLLQTKNNPDYMLVDSREGFGYYLTEEQKMNYDEIYSISVDNIKIGAVLKNKRPFLAQVRSSYNVEVAKNLFDSYMFTKWNTDGWQRKGDFIEFEFASPASYNMLTLLDGTAKNYARDLKISTSMDGEVWHENDVLVSDNNSEYRISTDGSSYKFLRLTNNQDYNAYWFIDEVIFDNE
jgi:hypothetical protein